MSKEPDRYNVSLRFMALIIFNALVFGALIGYLTAFFQWWNR